MERVLEGVDMSLLGRLMTFFPFFHIVSVAVFAFLALREIQHPAHFMMFVSAMLFMLYLMPPLVFRINNFFFPLEEGITFLHEPRYSSWWGGHLIQLVFIGFPTLETFLRLVPGVYSAWLRLWGAKIGKGVYWTPSVQLIDRSLLKVGDGVTFGHEVDLCAHMITRRKDSVRLLAKGITIGDGCLIGARAKLGPGVVVHSGVNIKYNTEGWPDQEFKGASGE